MITQGKEFHTITPGENHTSIDTPKISLFVRRGMKPGNVTHREAPDSAGVEKKCTRLGVRLPGANAPVVSENRRLIGSDRPRFYPLINLPKPQILKLLKADTQVDDSVQPFTLDGFLFPRLSHAALDTFLARRAIVRNLEAVLPRFTGTLLDVGCGQKPYRSLILAPPSKATAYIGLDLGPNALTNLDGAAIYPGSPDMIWDGKEIPLPDNAVDCAMATEVLEHCPAPEELLREVCRVLVPGGLLFLTVPFLWPLHDIPHDEYRFTPYALSRQLCNAGFADISLTPTGGWDSSLAQMIGLWVRRRPMSRVLRRIASYAALPAIKWLQARDRIPSLDGGSPMITGLAGTALKPSLDTSSSTSPAGQLAQELPIVSLDED